MERLNFTVEVNAPAHTVWTTMLGDATYRQWTNPFNEAGSWYEGSWDLGKEIRFIGPDKDGSLGGMIATVIENKPDERVTVEYVGEILQGVEYRDERSKVFGGRESYSFSESGGVTTVRVDLDSEEDFSAMFRDVWPLALARLKAIAEA